MSEKTVTIEIPISKVRKICRDGRVSTLWNLLDATREALAAHDATQNLLGLPWSASVDVAQLCTWRVKDRQGHVVARELTEAQASLMAAAPELADALERLLPLANETVNAWALAEKAKVALKKAGRR